jgi:hypothetical protein
MTRESTFKNKLLLKNQKRIIIILITHFQITKQQAKIEFKNHAGGEPRQKA